MPRSLRYGLLVAAVVSLSPGLSSAETPKTLETRFSVVSYAEDGQLQDFLWRITGKRLTLEDGADLVKNRIDEIVERVEALLEMYPPHLRFAVVLRPDAPPGATAEYSHRTRAITVARGRVTDGILAHEIAHAVICAYFGAAPPERAQEVLAQYVDKHLWE